MGKSVREGGKGMSGRGECVLGNDERGGGGGEVWAVGGGGDHGTAAAEAP